TGIGVGFLANGLLAPAVLGATAAVLPALCRDWRSRGYMKALAVAIVAAAPWLIAWPLLFYLRAPELFAAWLWNESLGHYSSQSPDARAGILYYLRILPWYAFPVWLLAAWTLWGARAAGYGRPAIVLP